MSLKLLRLLKRSRPLAKEETIAVFRHRYVIFLTLWLCAGVFPSVLWISLGRNFGAWVLEVMGYFWLLGASALAYNKLLEIYEGRFLNIYPSLQKMTKSQARKFRFSMSVACSFPLTHLYLVGLLWKKRRCPKETAYYIKEPLKVAGGLAGIAVALPLLLIAATLQTKVPVRGLPNFVTYWTSNGSTAVFNAIYHDTADTLVWMKQTKERVDKEKLDHAEANAIYAKKSSSKEISKSPIAPVLLTFGSTGTHLLAEKNYRSLSSDGNDKLSKLYVYESFVDTWRNWNPSLFYGFNPVLMLNPVGAYEFILISLAFKYSTKKMKEDYRLRTLAALDEINQEVASNPAAVSAKSKIKKLKRELETKD